jgi:hypothetical protein
MIIVKEIGSIAPCRRWGRRRLRARCAGISILLVSTASAHKKRATCSSDEEHERVAGVSELALAQHEGIVPRRERSGHCAGLQ